MGKVIRFVPKSERERARLIREAGAIYDSIFPTADPVSEQQHKAPVSHPVSGPMPIAATGFSCRDQDHRLALQSLLSGKLPRAEAMRAIAATGVAPADQKASIGCSIKWKTHKTEQPTSISQR
jgi:hypothetical protein